MTLEETVLLATSDKEFMRHYKRLTGATLGGGPPIYRMIDKATGKTDAEWYKLFDFIRDYVYLPVLMKEER